MTLRDVREPARLIAAWCFEQDDLLGFVLETGKSPSLWVCVTLDWPDDFRNWWTFDLPDPESPLALPPIVDVLEKLAAEARR